MTNRRAFLADSSRAAAGTFLWSHWPALQPSLVAAAEARAGGSPEALADDEAYWGLVALAFVVDGRYVVVNGGGQNPPTRATLDALTRGEASAAAQPRPNNYTLLAQSEPHRQRLARLLGVTADEVAITRNTTEGLNIVIHGLPMARGDEVVITRFDETYAGPALRNRLQRDGVRVITVPLDVPPDDDATVAAITRAITPRTRLVIASHIADGWGFVLPIARIAAATRRAGVPLLCDGALSCGAIPVDVSALGCDYYASSLHKWLGAPLGTGVLVVRRDRIATTWPLYGSDVDPADIRKFEDIGTRSGATVAAIGQALDFHETVGPERNAARLRYLLQVLLDALAGAPGITAYTDPVATRRSGLARIVVEGWPGLALANTLRDRFGFFTFGGFPDRWGGCYVSPNLFNTPAQMTRFADALRTLAAASPPPPKD